MPGHCARQGGCPPSEGAGQRGAAGLHGPGGCGSKPSEFTTLFRTYFSGDWDVHWGLAGILTHGQVSSCDGNIREKPESEAEARQFLESYRQGKPACFINGMVVHNTATGRRVSSINSSKAHWTEFPDQVIDALIKKGEVFTTAGGVVIEDESWKPFLKSLEGTVESVQGLPVQPLRLLLERAQAPAVTHVVFDMDGLLLDTESSYSVAQQAILDRWNKKFTWDLKAKMMGKKALEACQLCIDELGLTGQISAEEFVAEREQRLDKLFAEAALLPGVERLIRHLHHHGVPMAVATSSHRRHFDLKTTLHKELFKLMNHIVTGDQAGPAQSLGDSGTTKTFQFCYVEVLVRRR